MTKKLELLAPAGSPEKLKYAIQYGADAVYAGIPDFSMRYRINKFTEKSLKEAVEYVHKYNKKIYVTVNIYAHNIHIKKIEKHLKFLKNLNIDGVIVADPGIINLIKKHLPKVDIHLSTQANTTNWQAAKFWYDQGVKRIVLAREITLEDITEIKKNVPKLELEYFVHGAMCMSYSGRCVLSKWMANRSANLGDCAQPCRWKYKQVASSRYNVSSMRVEDQKGEYEIDLEEDSQGTYFFNSKDLNLLNYLDELQKAGVVSFKIEGRNKSVYYLTTVVKSYRKVLNAIVQKIPKQKENKITKEAQKDLGDLMHRGYTTGFLLGNEPEHNFSKSHEDSPYEFVGEIVKSEGNLVKIVPHNAIYKKDKLEIIAKEKNIPIKIKSILDENKKEVKSAHGGQDKYYYLEIDKKNVKPMSLLRKHT
ncbi:putative protease YhbU precursor [bacterium BMS3Abin15]|nr:putative protease YhbU precursor [bacterium BMS3Abin15]HDZ85067.1 U32 family peptidase [Candidatus Moranbacteria bacterium]